MIKAAIEAFSLFLKKIEPNTKYTPGSPFIELERLPGIVLEGPTIVEDRQKDYSRRPEFKRCGEKYNKQSGAKHYNLDFTVSIISKSHEDLIQLIAEFTAHITTIIDIEFPVEKPLYSCYMRISSGFSTSSTRDISGICEAKATVRIESVPMVSRIPATEVPAIQEINISINDKEGSGIDGTRVK